MQQRNNIFFTLGFMGTGKTTISKKAAKLLGIPCFDLDACIVDAEHQTINQIFDEHGEEYFRKLEQEYLQHLLLQAQGAAIIALGGGTPCYEKNMQWINQQGTSIYLQSSPERLTKILEKNKAQRPLIKDVGDVKAVVEELLNERRPFYEKAGYTIETDGKSFDEVAEELAQIVREHHP